MQGMHIFRRDRTMQLIKCTPWSTKLCSHPTIIKKMKTFLEVEGRMGPIPQPTSSQYRPLNWTQTLRSGRTLWRKERGQNPKKGTGRMLGNLFEDRNWLLPPNYLNKNCKNATSPKSIKEEPKTGGQSTNAQKCGWGPNCPFCKNQEKEDWDDKHQSQLQKVPLQPEVQGPQARCPQKLNY